MKKTEKKENNRLQVIIITIILIIILASIFIVFLFQTSEDNYEMYEIDTEIINNTKNKKDMLIYLYSEDEEKCVFCKEITPIVKNYDKYYNLNITYYNKDKTTKKKYKELGEKTGLDKIDMMMPTLIYLKDGLYYTINNIFSESVIYEFLISNNIIEKNKYNNLIDTTEIFKQVYSSNDNKLIILYNNDERSYKFRISVYNLSQKYNFEVYNIVNGSGDTLEANLFLTNALDDAYSLPILFVIKDKKVIDYTNEIYANKIEKFLKKYNFIK